MKRISVLVIVLCTLCTTITFAQSDKTQTIKKYQHWGKTYPGIDSGEIFVMNVSTQYYWDLDEGRKKLVEIKDSVNSLKRTISNFTFTTIRVGDVAYDQWTGEKIEGYKPVFIKEWEYKLQNQKRGKKEF